MKLKNLKKNKPIFMDVETHGFYCEIAMVQLYQEHWDEAVIIEYPKPDILAQFVRDHHTCWYNASYDFGTITHQSGERLGIDFKFDDLFYASRTAYPELPKYGLDLLHDHLKMKYYDPTLDKKKMQKSFATALAKKRRKATPEQIAYGKADVYTLCDLYKKKKVQKVIKKNKAYALDIESLKYSLTYQMNGIPVDRHALAKERALLVEAIEENKRKLDGLNPNSPKQCCEALGVSSTDKATLVRLIGQGNELAKTIFEQRRLLKADGMLASWDYDRIYTFFNVAGAITGRFTSSGGDVGNGFVNSQQISRQYQYMFHSISPKRVTFEIDYSTAELRTACSIMADETMYDELMAGKDLHIESAKLAGIQNPTKEDRQRGKSISFGLIFSMSANSFQEFAYTNYGVEFTAQEAKAIHSKYHRKYRGISNYHDYGWRNYEDTPVESAMGRRNICRLGTDFSNYATQASIAEATKLSVCFLVRKYPKALDLIINIIHDAIFMEVSDKNFKKWEKRVHWAMQKGWAEVCKADIFTYKDIPMPLETEIIGGY